MTALLHLSDLHFGTEVPEAVRAALAFAHALAPQAIIVSGDVTQRARAAEFNAARRFFEQLPAVPLLLLPGNHDIPLFNVPARLFAPYAGWMRAFGRWGAIERTWSATDWQVTTVKTTRRLRHKNGAIAAAQIDRVVRALQSATPAQARLVVVHQPMAIPPGRPDEAVNLLRGEREQALARWAEAGADLIVGGHIHLPFMERVAGLARPLVVAQAGTAVSDRTRHGLGHSLNVYRREAGALVAERWDRSGPQFVRAERTVLPLQRP